MLNAIATQMNLLSGLYALPTIYSMEEMGIDPSFTASLLTKMRDNGEILSCIRLIQFIIGITGQKFISDLTNITESPLKMEIFVNEFLLDCEDILSDDCIEDDDTDDK